MTYLNKRTGNTVTVPCRLDGPDWEEITEAKKQAKKAPEKAEPKKTATRKGADA